jgi:hypothetical protein
MAKIGRRLKQEKLNLGLAIPPLPPLLRCVVTSEREKELRRASANPKNLTDKKRAAL